MTLPGPVPGPGGGSGGFGSGGGPDRFGSGGDPDPERVLAQALRAMAGGPKTARSGDPAEAGGLRFTRLQILLIAVILGLLVGITAGLISLVA